MALQAFWLGSCLTKADGARQNAVGQRPSRRLRGDHRRLCAALPIVARCARLRPRLSRCGVALRHRARPLGRYAPNFPRRICATAICAPIPAIPLRYSGRCLKHAISSVPSTSRYIARGDRGGGSCRSATPPRAPAKIICGSGRRACRRRRRSPEFGCYCAVAFLRKLTSAARSSAEPMRCSGILVPGVNAAGPISNSLDTVSGVHTISSVLSAAEKL